MNKFAKKILLIIVVITACISGLYIFISVKNKVAWEKAITRSNESELYGKYTNDIKNDELIRLARTYFQDSPIVYLDGLPITLTDEKLKKINFESSWFLTHVPESIEYNPPEKWQSPYDYLNDKYIVSWLFMPGCEKRSWDKISQPNWFNPQGLQCVGGYSVSVIINNALKAERIDVGALL